MVKLSPFLFFVNFFLTKNRGITLLRTFSNFCTHEKASVMRNDKGSVSYLVILILAAIGAWYMYRSHTSRTLHSDFTTMIHDCRRFSSQAKMSNDERASMERAYSTLSYLSAKYNLNRYTTLAPSPLSTVPAEQGNQ